MRILMVLLNISPFYATIWHCVSSILGLAPSTFLPPRRPRVAVYNGIQEGIEVQTDFPPVVFRCEWQRKRSLVKSSPPGSASLQGQALLTSCLGLIAQTPFFLFFDVLSWASGAAFAQRSAWAAKLRPPCIHKHNTALVRHAPFQHLHTKQTGNCVHLYANAFVPKAALVWKVLPSH